MSAPDPVERPAKRLSPLTPLVRGSILVVAVVASNWDDALRGNLGPIALLLLALLAAGALYGVVSWLRTRYWIEADELRVDTGVVVRQSRRIRVDRLQGIDIAQPFVARLFGLAELKMDVAGGGNEGSLAFLPLAEAQDLRRVLLARRDAVRAHRPAPVVDDGVEAAAVTESEAGPGRWVAGPGAGGRAAGPRDPAGEPAALGRDGALRGRRRPVRRGLPGLR